MSFNQILTDRNYTRDYSEDRGHLSKIYMFGEDAVARIGIWDKLFHDPIGVREDPSELILVETPVGPSWSKPWIRGCAIGVTWMCAYPPPGLAEELATEIDRVMEIAKSCGVRIERGEVCGD